MRKFFRLLEIVSISPYFSSKIGLGHLCDKAVSTGSLFKRKLCKFQIFLEKKNTKQTDSGDVTVFSLALEILKKIWDSFLKVVSKFSTFKKRSKEALLVVFLKDNVYLHKLQQVFEF